MNILCLREREDGKRAGGESSSNLCGKAGGRGEEKLPPRLKPGEAGASCRTDPAKDGELPMAAPRRKMGH